MKKYHILFILIFIITGCDFKLKAGIRSGTLDDDYIEEPVSKLASQFKNALTTSNSILEKITQNDFLHIQKNYIHKDAKKIITAKAIQGLIIQAKKSAGSIISYKKMQWGFVPVTENKNIFLLSFKIVEHKKGKLNYKFVFKNDGKYKKIIGLYIKSYKSARLPNQT